MKFKIKKFIYLINDFTDLLLKKERENLAERNQQLTAWLIVLIILLVISLLANLYFYYLSY